MSVAENSGQSDQLLFLKNDTVPAVILFSIFAAISLFTRPLLPIDETRYLAVAWEMWQSGNYFVPTLNGEIYTHKPPLLFWIINLVWSVTGVSEIPARTVGPVAGLISILLTARLATILWPEKPNIAGKAALITATSGMFLLFASLTMFDALLTIGVLSAVIGLVKLEETAKLQWLLLFSFGIAFGVLAKGPVVLLHVLAATVVLTILRRKRSLRWYLSLGAGLLGATLLVFLWLLPALKIGGPDYQEAVLWTQTAGRITKSFAHQKPFWFFFALLPLILWPWAWSPFVWNKRRIQAFLKDRDGAFCLLWFVTVILLFSAISGKQVHYLIPALPAFSLVAGYLFEETKVHFRWLGPAFIPVIIVFLALTMALTGQLPLRGAAQFSSLFGLAGIAICITGFALFFKSHRKSSLIFVSLAPVTLAAVHIAAVEPINKLYDSYHISAPLQSHEKAGIALIGWKYHGEFHFTGRLSHPIAVIQHEKEIADWVKNHPGGALIGRTSHTGPDWQPEFKIPYRNRSYAVWLVPKEQYK